MKKEPDNLMELVTARLGGERLAALDKQPLALARGGIAKILQAACDECAGHPQPVVSAACRVLQLCGSVPTAADETPEQATP